MANIDNFQKNIRKAQSLAETSIPDEIDTDVKANINDFQRKLQQAKDMARRGIGNITSKLTMQTEEFTRKVEEAKAYLKTMKDYKVELKLSDDELMAKYGKDRATIEAWRKHVVELDLDTDPAIMAARGFEKNILDIEKSVFHKGRWRLELDDGSIGRFVSKLETVGPTARNNFDKLRVAGINAMKKIGPTVDDFNNKVSNLASRIRSFGVVFQQTFTGLIFASIQAIIPIIASLVPAIMAVANALAVVGGGAIGLAGSFGIAYAGIGAFAGMAVSAIKMLKDGTLQATAETNKYQASVDRLKNAWAGIIKQNQAQIFNTLSNGINTATYALQQMTPFLSGVAKGMEKASQGVLKWAQNSQTASRFFNMMNTTGVKTFNTLLSAAGKFGDGLVNVFTQLAPLFLWTAQQLEKLGASFQKWANSVAGQNAIRAFIDYTKTNLPKIGQIFTNVFAGIANLMGAFAQNSAGIFDWLVKLTGQFRTWSEQVGKSQGFKNFINYVQQNGPVIMQLIGNIVRALVAFGTAMAPIASVILRVVTAIAGFVAKLFETHPAIARMVGLAVILGGMLWSLSMPLMMIGSILSNVFNMSLVQAGAKILEFISKGQLLSRIGGIIANAFKLITGPLGRIGALFTGAGEGAGLLGGALELLGGPVGWIIAGITALIGIIVYLWKTNETFRNACINAWNTIKNTIMGAVQAVINWFNQFKSTIMQTLQPIMPILQQVGQVVTQVLGTVFAGAINTLVTAFQFLWTVVSVAFTAIGGIIQVVTQIVMGLLTAFIQFITGDFSGAWQTIQTTVQNVWTTIWNTIVSIFTQISNFIFNTLNAILGTNITSWGQIWSAITGFVTRIWSSVSSWFMRTAQAVWQHMVSAWNHVVSVGAQWVNSIIVTIARFLSSVIGGFVRVVSNVASHMSQALSRVISGGSQWVSAIISAMARFVSGVIQGFFRVVAQVGSGMQQAYSRAVSFVGQFFSAGVQLISSIAEGVASAAGRVASAVANAVSNAWHAVSSFVSGHGGGQGAGIGGRAMQEAQVLATQASDLYNDTLDSNLTAGLGGSIGINADNHMTSDVRHSMQENNRPVVNITIRNEGDAEMIRSIIDDMDSKEATYNLM